ncbi:hypothetical protein FS749_010983 [Ceratobasidium sp. UAMH 11750]|nr:hypothetical protein FS749_010983 [Ceratobasidium sp. UAMH 11750]
MFSPTIRSVCEKMLEQVLELQSPTQQHNDGLEISDPSTLTGDEEDIFYELQELEEIYDIYFSAPFKPSAVTFIPSESSSLSSTSDHQSILSMLSPGDPETQHVTYRLRGLQSILPQLHSVECSHAGLLAQRDDLIAVTNFEITRMFSDLWRERELQTSTSASVSTQGIRKVVAGMQY